jgi:hypothetical protein
MGAVRGLLGSLAAAARHGESAVEMMRIITLPAGDNGQYPPLLIQALRLAPPPRQSSSMVRTANLRSKVWAYTRLT